MTMTPDSQDIPFSYALIADPKHRIIDVDDVMDNSTVILIGSWNDCDRCITEMIAESYEREVDRFEAAYDSHIEEMANASAVTSTIAELAGHTCEDCDGKCKSLTDVSGLPVGECCISAYTLG